MNRPVCDEMLVGKCDYGHVQYCPDCEIYHVHLGGLSLRLQAPVFLEMAAMMGHIQAAQGDRVEAPRLELVQPVPPAPEVV